MPPLPNTPVPVLKVRLNWQRDGDLVAQTVHHFRYSGTAPDAATLATIANLITINGAVDGFQSLCDTHTGVLSCTITDVSTDDRLQGEAGTPFLGTRTGGQLAPGTAAVVRHSIGRTYRGGKPKSFLPCGTSTDLMTSGVWAASFVTAMDSGWGTFVGETSSISSGGTSVGSPCNVSYYAGGTTVVISPTTGRARNVPKKRTVPVVEDYTAHTTSSIVGSQRRRNRNA